MGAILLLAVFSIALGLFQIRRTVEQYTHRQVRLDRDSGAAVIQLRATLKTLAASYQRLDFYRDVTLAACPVIPTPICPEALAAFRTAAQVESGIQQFVRTRWLADQALWTSGPGGRSAFPSFDFPIATGTEKDLLRAWKPEFDQRTSVAFTLAIRRWNVKSRAEVRRDGDHWSIAWTE